MRNSVLIFLLATSPVITAFTSRLDNTFLRVTNNNYHDSTTRIPSSLYMANEKIGVFFGTSTGSTETAAHLISEGFGEGVASEPIEIDGIQGSVAAKFNEYDALIVGTPTWNTGADTERSGTGWDEIYYGEMQDLKLDGKKVAVFGLGDSVSYSENYADASGELHDVFEKLGCRMMGYTSQEGYEHDASKAIRGDLFCGLLLDAVNQEDLTEGRVTAWVQQLLNEGMLEGGDSAVVAPAAVSSPPISATNNAISETVLPALDDMVIRDDLAEKSKLLDESISVHASDSEGFVPHLNPKTGKTMWTSPDGRSCYYTSTAVKTTFSP
eukprot:CAMPEP_0172504384 /NCGR_PEP_ID=MMETSP1066-20121228/178227_1 /TAXON_ID=671091 /ORGANISM="Coscinodiscus wailesii, Strain CCMP2513" /LENGTH=324 /DNA_ID=CAMNT_0013280557 /DNA_START=39 /DNA_END=1013 /DNA_ORIENTATION=-